MELMLYTNCNIYTSMCMSTTGLQLNTCIHVHVLVYEDVHVGTCMQWSWPIKKLKYEAMTLAATIMVYSNLVSLQAQFCHCCTVRGSLANL